MMMLLVMLHVLNGASVVDYHITSSELFARVSYFNVAMRDESDHLPICSWLTFFLDIVDLTDVNLSGPHNGENNIRVEKYKWKDAFKEDFLSLFADKCFSLTNEISLQIDININSAVEKTLGLDRDSACMMRVNIIIQQVAVSI